MKVLRIRVSGLPLHHGNFDLSFLASQRVQADHSVFKLFGNIYVNQAEAFIGINASGKTSALHIIAFSYQLLNGQPLNSENMVNILGIDNLVKFNIDFYANGSLYHLSSDLIQNQLQDGSIHIKILNEKLWQKSANTKVTKSNIFFWDDIEPERIRDNKAEYLPDNVSISIALIKQFKNSISYTNSIILTNYNIMVPFNRKIPQEITKFLDNSIDYISTDHIDGKFVAKLKFHGKEELTLYHPGDLDLYLSSGTIKGIRVFYDAMRMIELGGYLIIDEIENHFNQELVKDLLRLFLDKKVNQNGAVIIFSTHYADILNELERNDSIFITRNMDGLVIDNLNSLLKRNDLKKSDVYQSNFLGGTAPRYEAWINLRKRIISNMREQDE